MSSTAQHSSTLWIVRLSRPNSTTSAPSAPKKRPSEVPPPVESSGCRPATSATAAGDERASACPAACSTAARPRATRSNGEGRAGRRTSATARLRPSSVWTGDQRRLNCAVELAGDDVRRAGAGLDVADLEAGRRKVRVAFVPAPRGELGEGGQHRVDRIQRAIADRRRVPGCPATVRRPDSEPRRPMRTVSPNACWLEGSPTMQKSMRCPRSRRRSTTRRVPSTDGPSSSLVITKPIAPG